METLEFEPCLQLATTVNEIEIGGTSRSVETLEFEPCLQLATTVNEVEIGFC